MFSDAKRESMDKRFKAIKNLFQCCWSDCGNLEATLNTLFPQETLEKQHEDLKKQREAVKYRLNKLSARQSELTVSNVRGKEPQFTGRIINQYLCVL